MSPLDNASVRRQAPVETHGRFYGEPSWTKATVEKKPETRPLARPNPLRMRKDISKVLRWLIPLDAVAVLAGYVCAWLFAVAVNALFLNRETYDFLGADVRQQAVQFLLVAIGVLVWFEHTGHYRVRMPFWQEAKKIVSAFAAVVMVDGFLNFATKQDFSRLWLVSCWMFAAMGVVVFRVAFRAFLRRRGQWQVPTLLVGNGITADEARAALESEPCLGYEIVAQIRDLPEAFLQAGRSWETLCFMHGVDYIVIALDGKDLGNAEQPIAQLMREGVPFSVSPPLRHLPVLGMVPQYFFNHDVMLMTRSSGLEQPLQRLVKRTFDIVASGAGLLVLSPLLLLVAVLVKLDGGPSFFPDKRIGLNGKKFNCLKFRSMVADSDRILEDYLAKADPEVRAEWQTHKKLRGEDPRVTRVGKFLRRTSIDELPQLLNVLKGDMSLVGPRPILPREKEDYGSDIAHYHRLRPGITGLWQVSGRNEVSYAQRVQMDSWYVRNWSLWHDIAIICKTVPVLMKRTGAY